MTDPVLDNAGGRYHFGYGALSRKTADPALRADEIGPIDMVLLSHHQHQDNFDRSGQEFTRGVPLVISTPKAARALPNAVGLNPWETYAVATAKVPGLRITATPGRHHPAWLPQFFAGEVTGFIIEYEAQTEGVIYITGDTVLDRKLFGISKKYTIDTVILHLGAVRFPYLTGFAKYTMDARDGVTLATVLQANQVIPIHTGGWTHLKENYQQAQAVFAGSAIAGKTRWLQSGVKTIIK